MDPSSSSTSETASATDRLFTLTLGPLLGRQATQSATISGDDLEEVWERAITVARVDLPNRYLCTRRDEGSDVRTKARAHTHP